MARGTCLDENSVLEFLSGRTSTDDRVLLHVESCDACREWLATMATMLSPVGRPVVPQGAAELCPFESRFELGRLLGRGGMAHVWEARDLATDKRVAIKIIQVDDHVIRRRALREGKLSAFVTHPNLLLARERFETLRGDVALVMDLLEGEDLADRLARIAKQANVRAGLSWGDARMWLAPVASALTAVHAAGVVHRDVKPQNIFIEGSSTSSVPGKVWLLDFGMAKLARDLSLSSTGGTLTAEKTVLGTPHYMAPEQLFGEPDVGPAADVWALGVVLFEMLAGERPSEGKSFGQVFRAVTTGKLRSLHSLAPHLPGEVSAFVHTLLVRDPAARPTMADVHAHLTAG